MPEPEQFIVNVGELLLPGPIGPQGPQGSQGSQGPPGSTHLYEGAAEMPYASAAAVRTALEALSEEELAPLLEAYAAPLIHTHAISDVTNLQSTLTDLEWLSWRGGAR